MSCIAPQSKHLTPNGLEHADLLSSRLRWVFELFWLAVSARPQWPGMASVLGQPFTPGLQAAGVCRSAQGYGDGGGRHGEANGGHVVAHCPASMFRVGSTSVPDLVFPLKSAG